MSDSSAQSRSARVSCAMRGVVLRRIILGAFVVWGVITVTFVVLHLAPGDPAILLGGPAATAEQLRTLRASWGLDRPIAARYGLWLARFVRGDWGISLAQGRPVTQVLADAVGPTVLLVGTSLLLSYLLGIAIGAWQAIKHRSWWDTATSVVTLLAYGIPSYWLALVLVMIFSFHATAAGWPVWLRFPAFGLTALDAEYLSRPARWADVARHLVLPGVTLTIIGASGIARFARGAMLEVRGEPFVLVARAKGLPTWRVEGRHALRNALIPLITLLGLNLPALFSGTVFVEAIFAWPGMGRVIVEAVLARDYPVVLATTAIFAALVVLGNALADLLYAAADPRIRREAAR